MNITNKTVESILTRKFDCEVSSGGLQTHAAFNFDYDEIQSIRIVRVEPDQHRGAKGLHIQDLESVDDLTNRLVHAVEEALNKNFETIYIHV
jgi:hypothetical protein